MSQKIIFTLLLPLLILACASMVFGQQQWQYSQYMNNNFLLNPAEGGTEKFTDIKLGFRTQWTGLSGSPYSMFLSGHHPINRNREENSELKDFGHHGVGGYISNDITGPTSRLSAYGSYSYHLPVSKTITASLGAFVGFKQYKVDENKLIWENNVPDATVHGATTAYVPDASLGIWVYSNVWYAGVSTFQLFQNNIELGESTSTTEQTVLSRHHFATAGFKFHISTHWYVVPSVVVKGTQNVPAQFDLNGKLKYEDKYWFGASYRNKDAVVALIGCTIKDQWEIGYSYDFNISKLRAYHAGSHEILIGCRIQQEDQIVPSQFW